MRPWPPLLTAILAACGPTPAGGPDEPAPPDCGAPAACAERGDAIFSESEEKAERYWTYACKEGEGHACRRMMELHHDEPARSDRFAARACELGEVSSCELLGNAYFVRALASGEDTPRDRAAELFERACELESYRACERASWIAGDFLGERARAKELIERTFTLGEAACSAGSDRACALLYDLAGALAQRRRQKRYAAGACRLERERGAEERPACEAAGSVPERPDRQAGVPWIEPARAEAERAAGEREVAPGEQDRLQMKDLELRRVRAVFDVCLSRHGHVSEIWADETSRLPNWDRRAFEALRAFRYDPFRPEGEPAPVCTSVTFTYSR